VNQTAQLLLDGSEETEKAPGGLSEFLQVNRDEDGLLTVSQAALVLGISAARAGQLCDYGKLRSWHFWKSRYVSARDVMRRAGAEKAKGGRPRKGFERAKVAAGIVAGTTALQVISDIVE